MTQIRRYQAGDLPALAQLMEAVEAEERAGRAVTPEALARQLTASGRDPLREAFVALESGGRLVGFVHPFPLLGGEGRETVFPARPTVHPDHRGQGTEEGLLRQALQVAQQRLPELPAGPVYLHVGCRPDETSLGAACQAVGLQPQRVLLQMALPSLERLPRPTLPAGLVVRPYGLDGDLELLSALDAETFADHWGRADRTPQQWAELAASPQFRPTLCLLAFNAAVGDEPAGFCLCQVEPHHTAQVGRPEGLLDKLGVRRPYRGRGLGQALAILGLQSLRHAGMTSAYLFVDAENPTGALPIYQRLGFTQRFGIQMCRMLVGHGGQRLQVE
ncbi:MAG: GNAT family N-acetyltransferase [Chloroflexi bacterium]|nr:GNAT family N-acetyltransferase [Chloroflexota bacterium]